MNTAILLALINRIDQFCATSFQSNEVDPLTASLLLKAVQQRFDDRALQFMIRQMVTGSPPDTQETGAALGENSQTDSLSEDPVQEEQILNGKEKTP